MGQILICSEWIRTSRRIGRHPMFIERTRIDYGKSKRLIFITVGKRLETLRIKRALLSLNVSSSRLVEPRPFVCPEEDLAAD